MGSHKHGQPYTIPDPSIYKIEDIPQLKEVQEALARQGLKNPWLRNEAWRYDVKQFGTYNQRLRVFLGRGFLYGLGLTVLTVAVEKLLGGGDHHHGNGSVNGNDNDNGNGNGNVNSQENNEKHE